MMIVAVGAVDHQLTNTAWAFVPQVVSDIECGILDKRQ